MKNRKNFFHRLNYSFGNEDWTTEQKALQTRPDDKVLCITASGDRPLHLLLDNCHSVTTVDANPIQNHLLKLKCAALQNLDYDEYLGFLGAKPLKERGTILQKLLSYLDEVSRKFWFENDEIIRKGVLYQGKVERLTKYTAAAFNLMRSRNIKKLFMFNDLNEQKEFLHSHWDSYFTKKILEIALNRRVGKLLAIDPGLYQFQDPSINVGTYIYDRMMNCLHNCLAKENIIVSLLYRGYIDEAAYPPYLIPQGINIIKERISRLTIKTDNILKVLKESPKSHFDRFSFSDIASYMSQENFNDLITQTHKAAKPGARFCIRQFSSNHAIPQEFANKFIREPELENQLEAEDKCFVYRFMVGKIVKN